MMLEGLTAEKALERVYENHPWAKPDSHHWLMLRCWKRMRPDRPIFEWQVKYVEF
jgi:hypothetical protein